MDDTLFDFQRTEQINLLETLKKYGIDADLQVCRRYHEINKSYWLEFERGKINKERVISGRFETLFAEYGCAADVEKVSKDFLENFQNICLPFDGAEKFLKSLADCGRIYIVTNGNTAVQKRHIADSGFTRFLSGAFISDEIGHAKPSLEFAEYVIAHIEGFARERAVWIGDSPTSDMGCAKAAGVDFIIFENNYDEILEKLNIS